VDPTAEGSAAGRQQGSDDQPHPKPHIDKTRGLPESSQPPSPSRLVEMLIALARPPPFNAHFQIVIGKETQISVIIAMPGVPIITRDLLSPRAWT
jgi:hypothetical protein